MILCFSRAGSKSCDVLQECTLKSCLIPPRKSGTLHLRLRLKMQGSRLMTPSLGSRFINRVDLLLCNFALPACSARLDHFHGRVSLLKRLSCLSV